MTTAMFDADILAFQAAAVSEKWVEVDDWTSVKVAEKGEVINYIDNFIANMAEALDAEVVCVLSDRDHNWRKDVLPSYKENRSKTQPPHLRWWAYEYIRETYDAYVRPTLEGDDVLGILSTAKKIKGEKIIVSIDKDMKTIPGKILNWNHANHAVANRVIDSVKDAIFEVTEAQADYFHLLQTLAGDQTDGYSGCPGIGLQTADEILDADPHIVVPVESIVSRGPRKGQPQVKWVKQEGDFTQWETIVSYYRKAGLTEKDALQQARVARICRASDYDFKARKVKLWEPT